MKDLLTYICQSITGAKISIAETTDEGLQVFTINAPKDVMGLLIGKEGKTIRAIRNICKARAIKDEINVNIRLAEQE